ncbi:response regulator [Chamaesiphon sp.]|uniref:response regulator n=1 Tax=Chamaesiphon sp. TaxID=2814140 RepID=UPI0035931C67
MKILVVEDDRAVAEALKIILSEQKYAVEIANDGQAGLDFIEAFDYDLLLLDAVLPKLDGISICRHVRSRGYMMPILLLTSKDSKHDRAIGLDAGADDYVVKPFEPEELCARIRALLRRGNDRARPVLTWEHLTLDPRNYEVTYQHQLLNLTPKEYSLLELFLRYSRHLFSCGAILEHLWAYEDVPSEEAVRTHIKGLRHKLKAAGAPTNFVETVYGMGYRLKQGEPVVYRQVRSKDRQIGLETSVDAPVATPLPRFARGEAPGASVTSEVSAIPNFLTEIWNRHYAQMLDRVATIERAIVALQDLSLTPEIRHQAWHSAHNLAGALGTFGLPLGSQVARQIELVLALNTALTPAQIPQLQSGVDKLRQEITSKKPVDGQDGIGGDGATGDRHGDRSPWLLVITAETDLASSLISTNPGSFEIVGATELVSSQLDRAPEAIVLDLDCFPQITAGLAVLSELERDYPNIPVVAISQPHHSVSERTLSANGTQRLRQRIEVARRGARLFLSKPMPAGEILLAVDRVIQQARTVGGVSVQKQQVRVTIVDDDRAILEGVSALLSLQGMTVTTLSEPRRFWETLEASTPDLLILDLDMPTHDGIDLCRAVRTDPRWAMLPILFLTAHAEAIASNRVFAAGADDFVTKPVVDATLVTRIINRLDRIGFGRSLNQIDG